MEHVIHNRRAAIRNTVIYAVAFALSVLGVVTRTTWWGALLLGLVAVWAIGGLKANIRAISHGFVVEGPPD